MSRDEPDVYGQVVKRLVDKATEVFITKTAMYGAEYKDYSKDDVYNLLGCKVDKMGTSVNISQKMFESDVVDCFNWLIFLYMKKLEEEE